jgi:hypothetical protein
MSEAILIQILDKLNGIDHNLQEVRADVAVLKEDVKILKQDVNSLKQDVKMLKHKVHVLERNQLKLIDDHQLFKVALLEAATDIRLIHKKMDHQYSLIYELNMRSLEHAAMISRLQAS